MVSAVSSAITAVMPAVRTASSPPTGRWFFKMPDLSNELFRAINAANACGTFMAICQAVHDEERRGRTEDVRAAAKAGQIGIGLRELARITGSSVVTIRKHCRELHRIGVIVHHRRGCQIVADRATGRIVTKNLGRTPTTLIYLTVTNDHLRPAAAKAAAERKRRGKESVPSPACDKDNFFAPSTECSTEPEKHTDSQRDNGLTAVEAGGHTAAKAGQDSVTTVDVDPSRQGIVIEDGTRNPDRGTAGRSQTPTGEERPTVANVTQPAQRPATASPSACGVHSPPDTGPADGSGMTPGWLDEFLRLTGKGRPDPVQAVDELRAGVANLKPDQRRRAKKAVDEAAKADPEAVALQAEIEARRAAERDQERREAEAKKADYRAAYRREKSTSAA